MNEPLIPLYEDNHLLILNKPAGLLTQPSGTEQDSLEGQAKAWIKEVYQKPGNVFLEAVHRLDKPASGIVVFSKTSKALARLNASMRAKEARKVYWAWVEGRLQGDEAVLEHYLVHGDFQSHAVESSHPAGKLSRLHYRVLERKNARTLVEIVLETGRYHQIRAQFAAIGCPVLGDRKYGSKEYYLTEVIALHHKRLELPHPISRELLVIEAPVPPAWNL